MNLRCEISGEQFKLSTVHAAYLQARDLPAPRLSPKERQLRRMTFRNQRHLFHRKCSATGKPLISMYGPEYSGPVVSQEYWWSDRWDPLEFGREFDFTRPFFPQFQELFLAVPQLCTMVTRSENCEYNAYCAASKNCYLSQSVADSENVYYSFGPTRSRDSLDCHNIDDCELCYEVIFGRNCYNLQYCKNVANCRDSVLLANCRNCKNCFYCTNLRNAEYCVENRPVGPAEYHRRVKEFYDLTPPQKLRQLAQFITFEQSEFAPSIWGTMNENVSGNQIVNSKNVELGFDILDCEDVGNVWRVFSAKNSFECTNIYFGEELYEIISGLRSNRCRFSLAVLDNVSETEYSAFCFQGAHDIFGSVGLRHTDHCILNIRYKPEEFRRLRTRIVNHMKETGEWGEFFPSSISPFPYNDSIANDIYQLPKDEVVKRGLRWREAVPEPPHQGRPAAELPVSAALAGEDICGQTYSCERCSRGFKIQRAELQLALKLSAPLPWECFECRYQQRLARLDPLELHLRPCSACGQATGSCWKADVERIILCEQCYVQKVN